MRLNNLTLFIIMKQIVTLFIFIFITSNIQSQIISTDSLPNQCKQVLQGVVVNFKTGETVPNAFVELYERDELLDTIYANTAAEFSFNVACNKRFNIKAYAENYANNSNIVFSLASQEAKIWDIKLFPIREFKYRAPDKLIDVDNLSFVEDHIAITSADYKILDKVVGILRKYPSINISINVHTDSNGMAEYNLKMTKDRADLILGYLIDCGIESDRLGAMGLGSSQLLNHCTPEVKCYESEHRINRRTELIVL